MSVSGRRDQGAIIARQFRSCVHGLVETSSRLPPILKMKMMKKVMHQASGNFISDLNVYGHCL